MKKKSDKGSGVSLGPKFGEIVKRIKDKDPELDEIAGRILSDSRSEKENDPEADLLQKIRGMLETIQPAERPIGATAKGRPSPLKTILVAFRLPVALNDELATLKGARSKTWHIERALMLYLKIMKDSQKEPRQ